ncbi:SWIM zinc finger family protein [Prunus dulcis]|uniref:SWIM zinc finger family protein n=1 Tax=Prunus dulcis TaxID=3755 RepID=A0A5H2XKV7_PRUDU|nr:SWIM zinc finger family protein [Prunus dulcis]
MVWWRRRSMKGHEHKIPRMEDILNLPVQDPPCAEFSAAHIKWVKVEGGRQGGDDIALIPFARVGDFVKGESSNAECPASFRIESRRRRPEGSISKPRVDGYLEYTLYWCSYGPEDYRENESGLVDGSSTKPASGKGSRPGRRHMMRAASDAMGTRAMYAPRISEEQRQKVMSMLYIGIPLDSIVQHHMEMVEGHGGPHNRDDFLSRNDVRNMERVIRNSSHELHEDDECSIRMWVQRHRKNVFYFQDSSGSEPFVLGMQTDWQLQQLVQYGHNGYIAFHSSFGLKKLKYPLCTLLVFNASRDAIPVAWNPNQGSKWRLDAFLVDDPSFEISIIREAFQCRVLLCIWRARHSWIRRLLKTCCNFDVQREMFKHLGWLLYCTRRPNTMDSVEEFMQVFVDQCAFMDYFKSRWLPNIELWANGIRSLPVAGPEPNAAIESYHLRLKSKLFNEQYVNSWSRVDWLIHTLTTEFQSSYWLDQYSIETGYFENLRDKSFSTNAWYQALQILNVDVILDEQNLQYAKVISQTDRSLAYTIWNPGSEFSLCDCPWSRLGNLCKHVIKVAITCKSRQVARPLLSAQVYRQALLTLLQNPPDDPVVLDHAILHATRLQQDIKGLEVLSNSGLLQPLPSEISSHVADNILFPRLH